MNESITAILEDRQPLVDIAQSLNMTVAGIVAHQSALKDGELITILQYGISDAMNNQSVVFRLVALLVLAACVGATAAAEPASKPNILLIVADNLGYGDLGCYGNKAALTPNIDRLAAEGVRCTDFYVASSSCSPSRGAILAGRHPLRNGLNHQLSPHENVRGVGLPHREKIIPQYLAPLGYVSGAFGKWNIGFAAGSRRL
jgi:hypothetical protein